MTRVLRPLTDDKWGKLREKIREQDVQDQNETLRTNAERRDQVSSEATSINDITQALQDDHGVLLDANREVRIKLYIGQVALFPSLTPLDSPFDPRSSSGGSGSSRRSTCLSAHPVVARRARRSC